MSGVRAAVPASRSFRPPASTSVFLLLLLLLLACRGAAAQGGADDLARLADAVAVAWQGGDAERVAELLAPEGVALELPGSSNPAVRPAQARAALRRLFDESSGGAVRVVEVRRLGGAPERGLARLAWRLAAPGDARELPLFLALERGREGWKVTEVRLVRGPDPISPCPRHAPCR